MSRIAPSPGDARIADRLRADGTGTPFLSRPVPLAALLLLIVLAARASVFGDPGYHVDDTFYLLVGERMRHGALLYVDIWDRKPPGIFLIYAAISAIGGILAVHLIAALFVWLTALVIAAIARRVAGAQGAFWAALGYVFMLGLLGGAGGQTPVFYNLFIAFAAWRIMACDNRLTAGEIPVDIALAMLAAGAAICVKPTALLEAGFLGCWTAWRLGGTGRMLRARWMWQVARLAALGAAPMLLCVLFYAALGHLGAVQDALVGSNFRRSYDPVRSMEVSAFILVALALPAGYALLSQVLERGSIRQRGGAATRDWLFVRIWLGLAVLAVMAFPNKADHYALPIALPLAVCTAPILQRRHLGFVLGAVLCGWLALHGETFRFAQHQRSRTQMAQLVSFVDRADPAHRLFIFGGSVYPAYALRARLHSPLVFPMHLSDESERDVSGLDTRAELLRALRARPAVVITIPRFYQFRPDSELNAIVDTYVAANCMAHRRHELTDMYGRLAVVVHTGCARNPAQGRKAMTAPTAIATP